ncbi:unnamed protein product, partial [Discosporangium mesarthrocarpum]
ATRTASTSHSSGAAAAAGHACKGTESSPSVTKPPSEWQEYWDEEVEASYYYNAVTGEATWIKPDTLP